MGSLFLVIAASEPSGPGLCIQDALYTMRNSHRSDFHAERQEAIEFAIIVTLGNHSIHLAMYHVSVGPWPAKNI